MPAFLARQGDAYTQPYSLQRDAQNLAQLEALVAALGLSGVISGGEVVQTTGYSVKLLAGTVLAQGGVVYTVPADLNYTAAVGAQAAVYFYATLTRTAANQADKLALDTYTLVPQHNLTGITPADALPLAVWATDGTGVLGAVQNGVPGKYLPLTQPVSPQRSILAANERLYVAANEQVLLFGSVTWAGSGTIAGAMRII